MVVKDVVDAEEELDWEVVDSADTRGLDDDVGGKLRVDDEKVVGGAGVEEIGGEAEVEGGTEKLGSEDVNDGDIDGAGDM
jgi:hypothetical protein